LVISSLKNQRHFDLVNKQGKKLHSPYFTLIIANNISQADLELSQVILKKPIAIALGMKVSKKLGKAVIRNKIKRRIRHLVRIISKDLAITNSTLGMIIIPKKNFDKLEFSVLLDQLKKSLWQYLGR
jgi:ribonuclease P protein component